MVAIDRRGHSYDMELRLTQLLAVRRKLYRRIGDNFVSHLIGWVYAVLI